ncbi:hypothetical protein [Oceanirhabdus seepicola]|uniref:Uncharacterized protein n=1 Tax=Oceanirhabdus seepicola TaxID=2828781 RepID=A0A9J6NXT1_9CLOT|nr:hypothetical protein [Oceanirhabdus seepicola]MCM1989319.1 hypothetical protein [Oceanirhabdus seepicola]
MDKFNNDNLRDELYSVEKSCKKDHPDHHDCHDGYNCVTTKKICFKPCEFCKKVDTKPIDLNKCTDRFLKLKVTINNVCFDKEISVGVILCDCRGKIIDFKCFTAIKHKDCHSCCDKACGTLTRKVFFNIPKSDACRPLELTARVVANYTSPCDDDDSCDCC